MALGNCTRLRNKNLCTLETSVCIICHSVVSHLQGDAQKHSCTVCTYTQICTHGNSSAQTVNRTDDIREAESGWRVMRFEREAREEEEGSMTVSSWAL